MRQGLWLIAPLLSALPHPALACATAPLVGREEVHTEREEALIVWDQARHIEHFVRAAHFLSSGASFGFLVPTPTLPLLAEASDDSLRILAELSAPTLVHETKLVPFAVGCTMLPWLLMATSKRSEDLAIPAAAVRVVGEAHVAGLDAVTLEADDASALKLWLTAHDFEFRPALERWVAPYLARHWKITAFRYVRPDPASDSGARLASQAVRISFQTNTPVYPYREPDDVPAVASRELQLFVVATGRVGGSLSDLNGRPWATHPSFSASTTRSAALAAALPGVDLPQQFWLSEFSDKAQRRESSDLVFAIDARAGEVHPPPIVVADETPLPLPYELPFAVWGAMWWRRRTKARRARATALND